MTSQWVLGSTAPDPAFLKLATAWTRDQADILLGFIWAAYDLMRVDMPVIDARDIERNITERLAPRIRAVMTGDEPFDIEHGPYERETMAKPPAQPPQYDLAFVWRPEERIMWPLEAKKLETPRALAGYVRDVRDQFLTCRYAPFSNGGAMLGYLLSGKADDALRHIETNLGCALKEVPAFPSRPHRVSEHHRVVPAGKDYPEDFRCYHLVLDYRGLGRARPSVMR
ncbi:MAG: hypothetical protein ABR987_23090 [Terracidiphilus sp.]|jgi:hypothetical protein